MNTKNHQLVTENLNIYNQIEYFTQLTLQKDQNIEKLKS